MKTKFTLLTFLFFLTFLITRGQQTSPEALHGTASPDWYANASQYVEQLEYSFYNADDYFRASNSHNGTNFKIDHHGFTAQPMQGRDHNTFWQVKILLNGIGRDKLSFSFDGRSRFEKTDKDLLQHFDFSTIEYNNDSKGMRQNFVVTKRPGGHGLLRVQLDLQTDLSVNLVNNNSLVFFDTDGGKQNTRLVYNDLKVWDATNKMLAAHMELNKTGERFSIVVDDKDAVYPVTIDPLNNNPEWTSSADGIIPGLLTSLQLRVNSLYGFTVANVGDLNNDSHDDIAIGAPAMANVVTGSGALLGVGAVFIYYGSDTGLADAPDKVLQPASAPAGALFGFSIDAGNISPDGAGHNDIIVGAPMDTYQVTLTGLLGIPQNINVTAGKVYYYRSEDLSAPNPTPAIQIRLQGDDYFGMGILGLLDNTGVNALFGFSLSVTEDMNADGRQDIVIGSPAYLGIDLLSVKSGAAFVYYSNNLGTTTPVELTRPTPTILGLVTLPLGNLNGLLFGYSVEGVGDYNNDGRADIAVGAPAGVNLNSLGGIFTGQVLGGSAYVYYGTGTGAGVNTAIGAKLQASPSGLLGSAANLFGYKIKAVRNASGVRNGNILISAPSGSVLSNLIGGLKLKAGQLHVFKKKMGAFTSPVTSDQALSSPRSSSVLSLLTGQSLDVSMLYGASMDNMLDVNCDGNGDLIVGEPLSTNVPIIGANITGGASYIYLGTSTGSYNVLPHWSLFTQVSSLLGVNATSLIGFSVAGGARTHGPTANYRAIIGGPTNTLDFGSGLLNLGNTIGTLTSFTFDNNGIGKVYEFEANMCGLITLPVTLSNFSGHVNDKKVYLNWTSENETNISFYELQRSRNGMDFETIAVVFAGNNTHNEYAYPDLHPFTGKNHYRLKIIDNDKKTNYSRTVSFTLNERLGGATVIAPNPARESIRARLNDLTPGIYSMNIYGSDGQLKTMRKVNITQQEQIETIRREPTMVPGIYWLHLQDKEGKTVRMVNFMIGD